MHQRAATEPTLLVVCWLTLTTLAACGGAEAAGDPGEEVASSAPALTGTCEPVLTCQTPQRLQTWVTAPPRGPITRCFAGVAAPQNLEFFDTEAGVRHRVHDLFPRYNCPFAIDTSKQLGPGGYALCVEDRTLEGVVPMPAAPLWALNMIPAGVAIDGAPLDPSGPWYDGGAPDPGNPFDRACSGWEYDPIHPTVSALVGVSSQVRGHVQPGPGGWPGSAGQFHYHGGPGLMLANLRYARTARQAAQPLVTGYSADGYWIIDGVIPPQVTSRRKALHFFSGYVLRQGTRTALPHTNPALVPAGTYDGTYVQDWVYDPAAKRALIDAALARDGSYLGLTRAELRAGTAEYALLDPRNGAVTVGFRLPGAPSLTYVYVMTPDWPEIPRWFATEPSAAFRNNIIPLTAPAGGPPARQQLYDACGGDPHEVHRWLGRPPY